MKVSKNTGLGLGIEADITGQGTNLSTILIGREFQKIPVANVGPPAPKIK